MTQPSLFGPVYPGGAGYRRGSDTSEEAAARVTPTLAARQAIVLRELKRLGAATGDEIMAALGTQNPNKVRPRLTELQELGLIEDTGTRRPTPSGGTAIVWRAKR